jgi:hypothetical protein
VCVCARECVCERERERECVRGCARTHVCVCVCLCAPVRRSQPLPSVSFRKRWRSSNEDSGAQWRRNLIDPGDCAGVCWNDARDEDNAVEEALEYLGMVEDAEAAREWERLVSARELLEVRQSTLRRERERECVCV